MELGVLLTVLIVFGYILLYVRGRYYKRENFSGSMSGNMNSNYGQYPRVDILG